MSLFESGSDPSADARFPAEQVERLLAAYGAGDEGAFEQIFALLYPDLRRIAHRHLRAERANHTLCTTALVHEVYLKLVAWSGEGWRQQAQFLAFSSRAMRHILVDYARQRSTRKRGSGRLAVTLEPAIGTGDEEQTLDLLALSEALDQLAARDARLARVVECRFFGGLTTNETAAALGMSLRSVERAWTRAKAYLYHLLHSQVAGPGHDHHA